MRSPAFGRALRRGAALLLLGLAFLPLQRLLEPERAGPAGVATRDLAGAMLDLARLGSVAVLAAALLLALAVPTKRLEGVIRSVRRALVAPAPFYHSLALFTLAVALGTASALGLHRGLPRLLDEMVQLLHARYFAWGRLAGHLPDPVAARLVQNSVLVPAGWVSVYPPGHTALLAVGEVLDVAWLVGPVLLGITTSFTFLALRRLHPGREATVRLAGLAVAVSPFLVFLGSGYLSHSSAAAGAAVCLYLAVRGWQGSAWWSVGAGAAAGFMVTSRPWTGLVLGAFFTGGIWVGTWWREGRSPGWLGRRLAGAAAGGAPFAVALALYDRTLFGSFTRLGYEVAFGPAHGLGFHRDPWGNLYGLREALAYTGADVATLGLHLMETPVSLVAVVAVFLLVVPRISTGTRVLCGWALLPVAANALYWHHGYHMGPRMLFEAGPAWAALAVIAGVGLVEGGRDPGDPGRPERAWSSRYPGSVAFWLLVVSVPAGLLLQLPARIASYRWSEAGLIASTPPRVRPTEPTLLFVHGTWSSRVASRLAAAGMRRDSVETALRRNDLCRVDLYARARATGERPLPELDLTPRPGTPGRLAREEVTPGEVIRVDPSLAMPLACVRELRSDRQGVLELAPLMWQTPLPEEEGPLLVVRDMGPEMNRGLVERFPERTPYLYAPAGPGGTPVLMEYERGLALLWGRKEQEPTPSNGARIGLRVP